jgi:hypothetical protein
MSTLIGNLPGPGEELSTLERVTTDGYEESRGDWITVKVKCGEPKSIKILYNPAKENRRKKLIEANRMLRGI